jgi:hypothetical protein
MSRRLPVRVAPDGTAIRGRVRNPEAFHNHKRPSRKQIP